MEFCGNGSGKVSGFVCYGLLDEIRKELLSIEEHLEPVLLPIPPVNIKEVCDSCIITQLQYILECVRSINGRISL